MTDYWPTEIGNGNDRLTLSRSVASMLAVYVAPDGQEYAAGCERGGHRGRRGWWFKKTDPATRSNGYRDFSPASNAEAIDGIRTLAGIDRQATLDAFASSDRKGEASA